MDCKAYIFHQACFGRVGADSGVDFALETFQIIFHPPKRYIF